MYKRSHPQAGIFCAGPAQLLGRRGVVTDVIPPLLRPLTFSLCLLGLACGGSAGTLDGGLGRDAAEDAEVAEVADSGDGRADAGAPEVDGGAPETDAGCGAPPLLATEVRTTIGNVIGTDLGGVVRFLGLPFAAPPLGPRRFLPPEPPACRATPLIAADYGPVCPQLDDMGTYVGSEDCLSLNIFTPALTSTAPRPVLFFMHGGGNIAGSARQTRGAGVLLYDGTALARETKAVVVTIQYRLNVLGFLVHPGVSSGNLGLLDQIAALRFVQANIGAFGGDPARVLLFGESAGAMDTCALLVSPAARGLYSAALMESGACVAATVATRESQGRDVVTRAGCDAAADALACLQGLSSEALVRAKPGSVNIATSTGTDYGPTIDGTVLPDAPLTLLRSGNHAGVPTVIGSNRDETYGAVPRLPSCASYETTVRATFPVVAGSVLGAYPCASYPSPREAFAALTTDLRFTCTARKAARALAMSGRAPVYRYYFSQRLENAPAPIFAIHGVELGFVFATLGSAGEYAPTPGEEALGQGIRGAWARLAASGSPGSVGGISWPSASGAPEQTMELNATPAVISDLRAAECDFWDRLVGG